MAVLAKKGKRYYAVFHVGENGKSHRKWVPIGKFADKKDAQIEFGKHLQWNKKGDNKAIIFADILPKYLDYAKITKAQATHEHERHDSKTLLRDFGHLSLIEITPSLLEKYRAKYNHLKATTWRNRLSLLKCVLNYANAHGFATMDPFLTIKIPRPKLHEFSPRIVEKEILDKVMARLAPSHKAVAVILRYSGCRPSEVFRLKLDDIDLKRGTIRINGAVSKTKRTRYIPIHKNILPHLKLIPIKSTQGAFAQALKRACRLIGISVRDVTPYVFRHTFATAVLERTRDLRAVQQLLGHTSIQMTTRYATALDHRLREAVDSL